MKNILTDEIISLIDWNEFFRFWKFKEKFPEVLQNNEAKILVDDANKMLKTCKNCGEAKIEWFPARSENDNIIINEKYIVRCFRQQTKKNDGSPYYCLADFVEDKIGLFAITAGDNFEKNDDVYNSLLRESVSQRLVEALSQFYQKKNNALAFAIGYPSLPDLRIMKVADEILDLKSIGITLNESCMMSPVSSVCGFYIMHPKARYFTVGKISDEQYADYAARGNENIDEVKKWVK